MACAVGQITYMRNSGMYYNCLARHLHWLLDAGSKEHMINIKMRYVLLPAKPSHSLQAIACSPTLAQLHLLVAYRRHRIIHRPLLRPAAALGVYANISLCSAHMPVWQVSEPEVCKVTICITYIAYLLAIHVRELNLSGAQVHSSILIDVKLASI